MRSQQQIEQYPAPDYENIKEQLKNIIVGDDRIREILKDFDYELEIKISFLATQ